MAPQRVGRLWSLLSGNSHRGHVPSVLCIPLVFSSQLSQVVPLSKQPWQLLLWKLSLVPHHFQIPLFLQPSGSDSDCSLSLQTRLQSHSQPLMPWASGKNSRTCCYLLLLATLHPPCPSLSSAQGAELHATPIMSSCLCSPSPNSTDSLQVQELCAFPSCLFC